MRGRYLVLAVANPYATDVIVLFFTDKLDVHEALQTAYRIRDENRGNLTLFKDDELRYIGFERLPFEGEGYALLWFDSDCKHIERCRIHSSVTMPADVREQLKRYRATRLTLDFDIEDDSRLARLFREARELRLAIAVYELRKLCEGVKAVKTLRGYHLVCQLPQGMEAWAKIQLRDRLGDDHDRILYDKTLLRAGFEEFTEVLFDYKWWQGESQIHEWREVPLSQLPVAVPVKHVKLPEDFTIQLKRGSVTFMTFEGQQYAVFRGYSPEEVDELYSKIERKLTSFLL
jgi:hypothetical protein